MQRARVPIAYSQGFSPHPKISYASAAPTGVASEAEYLEIGLQAWADPDQVRLALDAALSPGLDVLAAIEASGASLADQMVASLWRMELPGVSRRGGATRGGRVPGPPRGTRGADDQAGPAHFRRPDRGTHSGGCAAVDAAF